MIFTLWSNHHEMSYKVCRSVLGIQRDYFRPGITFWTTSDQIIGHILKNKKSIKSLKNRFWPKIQILVESPDIGRNDDLWPKIRSGDFKKCFKMKIQYINQFIPNFWKIEKNRFFRFFEGGRGELLADSAFLLTNIGQMTFPAGLDT